MYVNFNVNQYKSLDRGRQSRTQGEPSTSLRIYNRVYI
jgi:hypothetical protein